MNKKHGVTECSSCGKYTLRKSTGICVNEHCSSNTMMLPQQEEHIKTRKLKFGDAFPGLYICNEDVLTMSAMLEMTATRSSDPIMEKYINRMRSIFTKIKPVPINFTILTIHPSINDYVMKKNGSWFRVLKTNSDIEAPLGVQLSNYEWVSSLRLIGITKLAFKKEDHITTVVDDHFKLHIFKCKCGYDLEKDLTPDSIATFYRGTLEAKCLQCGQPISALALTKIGTKHLTEKYKKKIEDLHALAFNI